MIGKRLQLLRKQKGLSLSELAERAGVAKSYLSLIERDVHVNPSIQFLEKISGVLNVHIQTILQNETSSVLQSTDDVWIDLAVEAMYSGVSKEQFRQFLRQRQLT